MRNGRSTRVVRENAKLCEWMILEKCGRRMDEKVDKINITIVSERMQKDKRKTARKIGKVN